jgi:hypothetical protein
MGIDVDYLAGKQAIDQLKELLLSYPHNKRGKLADRIIKMVDNIDKEEVVRMPRKLRLTGELAKHFGVKEKFYKITTIHFDNGIRFATTEVAWIDYEPENPEFTLKY